MIFYLDILSMFCVLPTYLCPVAGLGAGLVPTEGGGRAGDRQVVAFTAQRRFRVRPEWRQLPATGHHHLPPPAPSRILRQERSSSQHQHCNTAVPGKIRLGIYVTYDFI